METPLKSIPLRQLFDEPIMIDANILMVGIENRTSDTAYSFKNMMEAYIKPLFESFTQILIHEMVYRELDDECKKLINDYNEKIKIVGEGDLYGKDPQYTTIFSTDGDRETPENIQTGTMT